MNKIYYYIKSFLKYSLLGLGALHLQATAQKWYAPTQKEVSTGIYVSTSGQNPFWLRSNQYGIVPLESQFVTFRGGIYKEYKSDRLREAWIRLSQPNNDTVPLSLSKGNSNAKNKFDYGYGLSAVANVGKVNQLLLPEAYLKARYGGLELYAGRRKEIVGLVDTTLTSGSYIWSGNALPMPKVQLSIPNYTSILGKGLISIKGAYAHGWFDNDRPYTRHVKLHQKWFYGKLGKDSWKVNFYGGFNHQVQWGGESPFYSINGKLPQTFRDYLSAVIGIRGSRYDSETDFFDANRVGNHLGTIDIGLTLQLKTTKLLLYRQNIYDDGSLYYLTNIADGLNGISLQLPTSSPIRKITLEYLNTTSQGGNIFSLTEGDFSRGRDNYFLNAQFADGYTYRSHIIGTPFIQLSSINWQNGKYAANFYFDNNRVKATHIAFTGKKNDWAYTFKMAFIKNYGTYNAPISFTSNSFLIMLERQRLQKLFFFDTANITIGIDASTSSGISTLLKKNF